MQSERADHHHSGPGALLTHFCGTQPAQQRKAVGLSQEALAALLTVEGSTVAAGHVARSM
jgi:DNA-binding transcriptional regulator YiaG